MTAEWVPTGVDTSVPSPARIYDYFLGGKDNYAVDRTAAEAFLRAAPQTLSACRHNRAFLSRAVTHLVQNAGIDQFIDIGTGLPTQQNVHEVAQQHNPDARVVYIDNDPIVAVHARALLARTNGVALVQADLHEPEGILTHPDVTALIDFDRPVAVLLLAVLHFFPDADDPHGIVARLMSATAPGSHLVISHGTSDPDPDVAREAEQVYDRHAAASLHTRTAAEVARFFTGTDLLDPGLVYTADWRPSPDAPPASPSEAGMYGAIARKP
ncbi:SAM-dependent methyltransferase [Actinomadura oligospora]|uniref:SAM-dependent methyltransferase n=1 Tax=Actinomadura oligospora TaxID=111804 RepID=UPI00047B2245|nr:SAM-dependent methyltransferase [Actinomadura oligospora]